MSTDAANLYFNTLVFTIISGIAVIVLLAFMLSDKKGIMKPYTPFLVTLQVGVVFVILYAMISVLINENKLNNKRKGLENRRAHLLSCPDYWTLDEDGKGKRTCQNTYKIPDSNDKDFLTMQGASSLDLAEYDMKKLSDICPKLKPSQLNTSWSALKSECDAYSQ